MIQADVAMALAHVAATVTRPVSLPEDDKAIALRLIEFRAAHSKLLAVSDAHRISALEHLYEETRDGPLSAGADKLIRRCLDRLSYDSDASDEWKSEAAEFAIVFDPTTSTNWWHVAGTRTKEGRTEDALDAWNVAVDMDPSSSWPRYARGRVLAELGRDTQALADFDRYVELDPNPGPYVYADRSRLHYAAGRFEAALQDADRAIAKGDVPDPYPAHFRAYILYAMRRYGDALRSMQRALELAGMDTRIDRNCALLLALTGEHAEALSVLETVVASNTDGPDLLSQLLLGVLRRAAGIADADVCFHAALAAELSLTPFRSAEFRAIAHSYLGNGNQGLAELAQATAERLPYDVYDEPLYALIRGSQSVEVRAIAAIEALVAGPDRSRAKEQRRAT